MGVGLRQQTAYNRPECTGSLHERPADVGQKSRFREEGLQMRQNQKTGGTPYSNPDVQERPLFPTRRVSQGLATNTRRLDPEQCSRTQGPYNSPKACPVEVSGARLYE